MTVLNGRVAFITGAARGQGRAHAVGLAAAGADILALDICDQLASVPYDMATPEDLEVTVKLVEATGRRIVPVVADVRDLAAVRGAVALAQSALGGVDIVIANAGIMTQIGPRADEDQTFYDSIDVMLTGAWHTLRATSTVMIEQGRGGSVVLTSSTAGARGIHSGIEAGSAGYAAAKHAVIGLMRVYSNLLAPHHIRVNAVLPTGTDTPMVNNPAFEAFARESPDVAAALQNPFPITLIEPDDVMKAVRWLVSDDARYVTGISLPVDAGFLNRV